MINEKEILRAEGLKRTYLVNETKIEVLKGINLTINSQEFIAIMGKSGSGKTTLLKLLGMLDRPTEGKVFFKGETQAKSKTKSMDCGRVKDMATSSYE